MNKTELIAAVAEQSGLSKKDAEKAVSSTIDTIINTVAEGEKIQIAGFGTFEQRQRNARTGCDPRTGKSIEIPASKVPAFKAGKGFKDVVSLYGCQDRHYMDVCKRSGNQCSGCNCRFNDYLCNYDNRRYVSAYQVFKNQA